MKIHFNSTQMIAILTRHGIEVKKEKVFGKWINIGGPHEKWQTYDMHVPYKDGVALIEHDGTYYTDKGPFSMIEYQVGKIVTDKLFELLMQ